MPAPVYNAEILKMGWAMKVLIIGNGGREHTLAWKVAQSPRVTQVFVAPGNAGTATESKVQNIAIDSLAISELINFAKQEKIGLTIVGPEAPLAAGIVDQFKQHNLPCFGPTQLAAQLESSKAFSKAFMQRHHIPTAAFATFQNNAEAKAYVKHMGTPIVIKADGLAAGKGVVVAFTETEALQAIDDFLPTNNAAGGQLVIEEFIAGEEASFIVIADGLDIVPLASAQDHKARDNGDTGPNTGGMGAYSPAPVLTSALQQRVINEVIKPTLQGMLSEGHPYTGFLYAGLMIDKNGNPKVLEFNCRLGDPETQVILYRLKSDLTLACEAALNHALSQVTLEWDNRVALGVVLAAGGYPNQYAKGAPIHGLEQVHTSNCKVFHAGTALKDNAIVTNGGRVLCVVALGDTVSTAQQNAYAAVKQITWDGVYYRTDIGHRAIARE